MMDLRCPDCGHVVIDYLERDGTPPRPLECPTCHHQTLDRALLGGVTAAVHGDEIDIWVKHGICNDDGSPRHYRSRAEMRRVTVEKNLVNKVEHIPPRGGDKSKHTQRFV